MRSKLKLNLDELAIDSFDTHDAREPNGTVFGEQCTCYTQCTCPGCPTCYASCNGTLRRHLRKHLRQHVRRCDVRGLRDGLRRPVRRRCTRPRSTPSAADHRGTRCAAACLTMTAGQPRRPRSACRPSPNDD